MSMSIHMPIALPLQAETPTTTPPSQSAHLGRNQGPLKTDFATHLQSSFQQSPADLTDKLAHLLKDFAAATQSIRLYFLHSGVRESGMAAWETGVSMVTRMMFETLCHDAYACMIPEQRHEVPLSSADTVLQVGYVLNQGD